MNKFFYLHHYPHPTPNHLRKLTIEQNVVSYFLLWMETYVTTFFYAVKICEGRILVKGCRLMATVELLSYLLIWNIDRGFFS